MPGRVASHDQAIRKSAVTLRLYAAPMLLLPRMELSGWMLPSSGEMIRVWYQRHGFLTFRLPDKTPS